MQATHVLRPLLKGSSIEQQKAFSAIADLLDSPQERFAHLRLTRR
jgi:hypothetical protein